MKAIPKIIVGAYLCCFIFAAYVHFSGNLEVLRAGDSVSFIFERNFNFVGQILFLAIPGLIYLFAKKIFVPTLNRFAKNPMQEIRSAFTFNLLQILILIVSTAFISWSVYQYLSGLEDLKADGAPTDFIEARHQDLGWLVAFMLVPSTLIFYSAGFFSKKKIYDYPKLN